MCQERESVFYLPIKESEYLSFSSGKAGNPPSAKKSRKSPAPRLYYILGLRSHLQHKSIGFVHSVYRTQDGKCLITLIAGFGESAVWHVINTEV